MTDTDGPTLRDALFAEKLSVNQANFSPMLDALKRSGALDNIAGMAKEMSAAVALTTKANVTLRSNIVLPGVHGSMAKAAAAALLPAMRPPVSEAFKQLVTSTTFKSQQRMLVLSLLAQNSNSMSGIAAAAAAARAGTIAQLGARAIAGAAPVEPVEDTPEAAAYGSHQLSFEQTLGLTALIWMIVQAHLQNGSNKHLMETHLLTLCLMTLIWCALAAAP